MIANSIVNCLLIAEVISINFSPLATILCWSERNEAFSRSAMEVLSPLRRIAIARTASSSDIFKVLLTNAVRLFA